MSVTLIRQIPDDYGESTGLAKYKRSRMPGCKDRFVAAMDASGTFITGLDEKTQQSLEKVSGYKDLSPTSKFWETFEVVIEADRPKTFDSEKSIDVIGLKLLLANGYVAPDEKAANTASYRDAQYYAYTEEGEEQEEIGTRKKRDRALTELLGISESKDKMILYGQYLEGLKYHPKLKEDTLYKMLRAYIEEKDIQNANNFMDALNKSVEELQQKVIVDRSLKQRLIVKSGVKNPVYQYGQVTLGNTLQEVYNNLSKPEFAPELVSLQKELDKK